MSKEQFLGILRHVITFVGGLIVAKGQLDPTVIETVGGGVIALAGLLWSMFADEKKPITAAVVMAELGPAKTAAVKNIMEAPGPIVNKPSTINPGTPQG